MHTHRTVLGMHRDKILGVLCYFFKLGCQKIEKFGEAGVDSAIGFRISLYTF